MEKEKAEEMENGEKGFQYYRSPGKGVGKGLNQLDDDWYNVWGGESVNDHNYDCHGGGW